MVKAKRKPKRLKIPRGVDVLGVSYRLKLEEEIPVTRDGVRCVSIVDSDAKRIEARARAVPVSATAAGGRLAGLLN